MHKDPRIYVDHMLEAIAYIELDTAGYDFERFRKDRMWETCAKDLQPLKAALARIRALISSSTTS